MARKTENISVLQADQHGIAWLRVDGAAKRLSVLDFVRTPGDFSAEGALEAALADLVRERGIANDRVFSLLARHDLTTRILTLPSHERQEITSMLQFSAEEFVPFSASELIINHAVLRELPNGESVVFAALAHKDLVNRHLAVLNNAGVEPEQIFLSTTCLVSAVLAAPPKGLNRYALVHLAPGGLEIAVLDKGALVYSRGTGSGQNWAAIAENPEAGSGGGLLEESGAEELASEIRGTLAAYRRESEDGEGVEAVLVAGDGLDTVRLCASLAESLGRDCRPADMGGALAANGSPDLPLPALGAALTARGQGRISIGLLPEHVAEKRKMRGMKLLSLRVAAFAAVALLGLGGLYWQAVRQRGQLVAELEARIARMEPNAAGIKEKREQLKILRRQVDRKGSLVEQLAAVVDAAPPERVNITRISLERQSGISLWGRAKTVNDVAEFSQNLRNRAVAEGLTFFSHAHSLYEQQAVEQGQQIFTYQIDIPLTDEKEADETL
ncbi:MAG: hypothetical protein GX580_01205 [Candidatus Hydrogenedens sp.]|nr:PilN domain-containing protein [Candidatus Hydrogenedentota bacterium]NLF56237.1 hypothetical protein [Candidatus Hydrogenedens sp.]